MRHLFAAVLLLALAACGSSTFVVEQRDTPVHVWATAPELARSGGGVVDLLVYVAGRKVVEGPVRFASGVPTVELPTVYTRAGSVEVRTVVRGSSRETIQQVGVAGESWVQIVVSGDRARVFSTGAPPNPWGR